MMMKILGLSYSTAAVLVSIAKPACVTSCELVDAPQPGRLGRSEIDGGEMELFPPSADNPTILHRASIFLHRATVFLRSTERYLLLSRFQWRQNNNFLFTDLCFLRYIICLFQIYVKLDLTFAIL